MTNTSGVLDDDGMTDTRALEILQDYLGPEYFRDFDGDPPLPPHLLWGLFWSYCENYLSASSGLKPQIPDYPGVPRSGVTALEGLTACRVLTEQLQGSRWWIAEEARKEGCSWAEVGDALGMSKQAAWEGFRKYTDGYRESAWPGIYNEARALAGESPDS